jgi:hypothetical protein
MLHSLHPISKTTLQHFLWIIFLFLLTGCSTYQPIPTPTIFLYSTPTEFVFPSDTPAPIFTPTLPTTSTPTAIPTLQFYSLDVPTLVATAESCSKFPDKICIPVLIINLSGKILKEYEVTASWPGFAGETFKCPQQALLVSFGDNMAPVTCNGNQITFTSVGLTEITINIKWKDGSVTQTLAPTYEVVMPQGPTCQPQCFVGKAEMTIP